MRHRIVLSYEALADDVSGPIITKVLDPWPSRGRLSGR